MKSSRSRQGGQAFVELALILFLFFLVTTAVLQLVWLGSAQMRCQLAARRAAWLFNTFNNANLTQQVDDELLTILPGCKWAKIGGKQEEGIAYQITYTVPALGYFRLASPNGFPVSARSAVISYNPKPIAPDIIHQGISAVMSNLQNLKQ
jgi:hypothetical protein